MSHVQSPAAFIKATGHNEDVVYRERKDQAEDLRCTAVLRASSEPPHEESKATPSSKQQHQSKVSVLPQASHPHTVSDREQSGAAAVDTVPLRSERFFLRLLNLRRPRQHGAAAPWEPSSSRAMAPPDVFLTLCLMLSIEPH
ncbi:hypothetical protein INR49_022042, partial [Caranx melampygus]